MPCSLLASAALICESHIAGLMTHVSCTWTQEVTCLSRKRWRGTVTNSATRREMEKLVGLREIFLWQASIQLRWSQATVISNADVPKTAEVAYDLRIFICCIFHCLFYFIAFSASVEYISFHSLPFLNFIQRNHIFYKGGQIYNM